jgi:hypothetical protein
MVTWSAQLFIEVPRKLDMPFQAYFLMEMTECNLHYKGRAQGPSVQSAGPCIKTAM